MELKWINPEEEKEEDKKKKHHLKVDKKGEDKKEKDKKSLKFFPSLKQWKNSIKDLFERLESKLKSLDCFSAKEIGAARNSLKLEVIHIIYLI